MAERRWWKWLGGFGWRRRRARLGPAPAPAPGADGARSSGPAPSADGAPSPGPAPSADGAPLPAARRALFLDDDPNRARAFLLENPEAVWVETVADCLAQLRDQSWDEIHLDHDLGGKTYVDSAEADCGMEVVRWLCGGPRPHLEPARFYIHTHHVAAGLLMVLQMRGYGYRAEFRPFGVDPARLLEHNEPPEEAETDVE